MKNKIIINAIKGHKNPPINAAIIAGIQPNIIPKRNPQELKE